MKREFYFIRHGRTDWNESGRIQGTTDVPLNDNGREDARKAGEMLKDIPYEIVYSSPLSRAYETALLANIHQKDIIVMDDLKERSYGSFEGKMITNYVKKDQSIDTYKGFDGESRTHAALRMKKVLQEILDTTEYEKILISTHGSILSSFIQLLKGIPEEPLPRGAVKNGSLNRIDYDGEFHTVFIGKRPDNDL